MIKPLDWELVYKDTKFKGSPLYNVIKVLADKLDEIIDELNEPKRPKRKIKGVK